MNLPKARLYAGSRQAVRGHSFRLILTGLVFLVALAASLAPLRLPRALPATAPDGEFSAGRAMQHVQAIGGEAHPVGSPAMQKTALYIQAELLRLGWEAQIQGVSLEFPLTLPGGRVIDQLAGYDGEVIRSVELNNVLARLRGSGSGAALLILAHPDSTPFGPGAGDNATGAAVSLEVARALAQGKPLKNDVILLFDDGEELGYLGGYAFTLLHPWMKDVKMVIGLDTAARGPVVLLQTSRENGAILQGYSRAVTAPAAYGFLADVNQTLMGDTTEILPFLEANIPAVDLEDIYGFVEKHTPQDVPVSVQPGSVQHMGDQVLALARAYGSQDQIAFKAPGRAYFTIWGLGVVNYSHTLGPWLIGVSVLLSAGVLWRGLRRGTLAFGRLGEGILVHLGLFLFAAAFGTAVLLLFLRLYPSPNPYIDNYVLPSATFFSACIGILLVLIFTLVYSKAIQRLGEDTLALSSLGLWLVLAILAGLFLPIGAYAFQWPLLFALSGWLLIDRPAVSPWVRWAALLPACVIAVLLVAPLFVLAYLSSQYTIPLMALMLALLLGLWAPLVGRI